MATQHHATTGICTQQSSPTNRPPSRGRLSRQRRGVVLLLVISLLTLFILIGVTYAIVASTYLSAAKSTALIDQVGDQPQLELDEVFTNILSDTSNNSTLKGTSPLLDMYGTDGICGELTSVGTFDNGNQTIRFSASSPTTFTAPPPYTGATFSNVPDYYNGRVITFWRYNGSEARPISTRVMQYAPPDMSGSITMVVAADFTNSGSMLAAPQIGDRFVINGAPYNGTGAGYQDSTSPALGLEVDVSGTNRPIALLPHFAGHPDPDSAIQSANAGGFDESYDAVDFQNFFLALDPPGLAQEIANSSRTSPQIPSYHRPDLVNYWTNAVSITSDTDILTHSDLLRRVIARPMPWDHPNFTGSNPAFPIGQTNWMSALSNASNLQGIWDVDNDGDGVPDSIWIDPGLPIITTPDGRKVKRLAAIKIIDLDSRLDINATGNLAQTFSSNHRSAQGITLFALAGQTPSAPSLVYLPRGLGYGPAEIDWQSVIFGSDDASYTAVLQARYQGAGETQPGTLGDELLSARHAIGMVPNNLTNPSSYASPPDVYGRGAVGTDHFGQPVYGFTGDNETVDDPYEVQYDHTRATADRPFDVSDLEWLLRHHDSGVGQKPTRLSSSAASTYLTAGAPGSIDATHAKRQLLTTMSSHVPVPPGPHLREERATGWSTNAHRRTLLDLYYKRMQSAANFSDTWNYLVPFEMRHGHPFNINRPFGNGIDDNSNGVIDDYSEGGANAEQLFGYTFEKYNDITAPDPRQLYARQLYTLLMLIRDSGGATWQIPEDVNGDGPTDARDTAHYLAQYAVNVVDFRDNDSINTGFEYDVNPFDGWDVDGDLSTDEGANRGVVWGAERPELLITETLATHDLRTEDLMDEEPNGGETAALVDATVDPDPDFDQRYRPSGSFFLELFNPHFDYTNATNATQQGVHKPLEIYDGNGGVALNRISAGGAGSPVWRVIIVQGAARNENPDVPAPEHLTGAATGAGEIERSIYFTDPAAGVVPTNHGVAFFPSSSNQQPSLKPGRYAIVGSSGVADAGNYTTYFGRNATDPADVANTRRLVLTPNANADTNQLAVNNFESAPNPATVNYGTDVAPVIAIPIDSPRSISISEPAQSGYPVMAGTSSAYTSDPVANPITQGTYVPPIDTPLDNNRTDGAPNAWDTLKDWGTKEHFRAVHLQRLANPLLPWNSLTNPYLTVDTASVDLTVFNGIENKDHNSFNKDELNFQTAQRGGAFPEAPGLDSPNAAIYRNLWLQEPAHGNVTADSPNEGGAQTHIFNKQLFHTLGYLNRRYHPYFDASASAGVYLGAPSPSGMGGNSTFPWLTFLNRPFASPYEMMLVPSQSQSRLLTRVTLAPAMFDPYDRTNYAVPYSHLFNFYQSTTDARTVDGPMFSRLLDYVSIPSPYAHSDHAFNMQSFTSATYPGANNAATYRPPFAFVSRFREPGRININTVSDSRILEALFKGMPQYDPSINGAFVDKLLRSRQGYTGTIGQADVNFPTIFAQPFRAQDAGDLAPLQNMEERAINAGLMRRDPDVGTTPLFTKPSTGDHADSTRNPYFRYQGMQKVGNLVTTRSNCFACWITIGYFEAEPAPIDAAHRDGYSLGQEIGYDSGEVQRHRGFYIFDRSIPVGFIPGKKLNTDDAVLLRRFIE